MHSIAVITLLLVVAVAVPLSAVVIPFVTFRHYAHNLSVPSSHNHIQNSLLSIRDAGFTILCLMPPLSHFAPFCSLAPSKFPDVYATLGNLVRTQRTMAEQLARHDLLDSFTIALTLRRASDTAFAYDDLMMLFEDGNRDLRGIGDVRVLVEINRASHSLWTALWRITLHIELGLGRLSFIDRTSHAGMKHFVRFDRGLPVVSVTPRLLSHIISISSAATADSIQHIGTEIDAAQAALSVLLDALHRFAKGNECTTPAAAAVNICAEISILWDGGGQAQAVGDQLTTLTRILEEARSALPTIWMGTARVLAGGGDEPVRIDVRVIEENVRKLGDFSFSAWQARSVAEARSNAMGY